jgi:para-aminobenzoate synthetase component 1
MLPAGSICGAPKAKTISIIQEVEQDPRGYYTGIFGYFDGEILDSAVNIRYLEKNDERLLYRSGGGITFLSDQESEYKELIEKIYVPVI